VREGRLLDAEAQLRWLDRCSEVLAASDAPPLALSTTTPRRGRPARNAATA
jgi:hypothetical protein